MAPLSTTHRVRWAAIATGAHVVCRHGYSRWPACPRTKVAMVAQCAILTTALLHDILAGAGTRNGMPKRAYAHRGARDAGFEINFHPTWH
mmetsp:Transcript_42072/g.83222  ORF Transcript_42072/g.83222 Transcript_42072/m.83222 type:complete len:90 (+) Transcript_42072:305-574(+)